MSSPTTISKALADPRAEAMAWTPEGLEDWSSEVIQGRKRKRVTLYSPPPARSSAGAGVILKSYDGDRASTAFEASRMLWNAGFGPPSQLRVARPIRYVADQWAVVEERAQGAPWARCLETRGNAVITPSSERAADWLAHLHRTSLNGWHSDTGHESPTPIAAARALTDDFGDQAAQVASLAWTIQTRLQRVDAEPVASHGDFHPLNVYMDGDCVTVIDLDTLDLREPGYDVGYAIGQLLVMSRFRTGSLLQGFDAGRAFWNRYDRSNIVAWERVRTHVARTLLMSLHYELCVLRNGRTYLIREWTPLIDAWLEACSWPNLAAAELGKQVV